MKTFKQILKEASMWDWIYKKNKGVFYRGVGRGGKGTGVGVLGKGVYLTWERGMAQAFADRQGAGGEVETYKLKRGLKIIDAEQGEDFIETKKLMGFEKHQTSHDPMFATMLTMRLKDLGYDGAVSDDVANGICIFNAKNVKEIK